MKGKICKDGNLEILRGKEYKHQICPFESCDVDIYCGDHCPLFGEPEDNPYERHKKTIYLRLCNASLYFDEFVDERG